MTVKHFYAAAGTRGPAAPSASYRYLGATIESDVPLGVAPAPSPCADVTVARAPAPISPSGTLVREQPDLVGVPALRIYEDEGNITYWSHRVGWFGIERSGRRVWHRLDPEAEPGDVETVLSGPIVALTLQLQGRVLLHAGAVLVEGQAVGLAGPHGAGKSTLTASLLQAGHPMLTDDILPLTHEDGRVHAHPSVPRLKLWPDSLAALGEDEAAHDPVLTWSPKRKLRVGDRWAGVAADAAPLAVIYLLSPHRREDRPTTFDDLPPAEAALALLGNTYMADMLHGERAARALTTAARLATVVRVRRISYARTFARLPALCAAILDDVRAGVTAR
jgi:hypothetical protein